jgi:hypothetical protein
MLRIPHCLDSQLTDGGKAVSPLHRPRSTPQKHYFSASGTHLGKRLRKPQGLVPSEGLGKLKKLIHLITSQTGLKQCLNHYVTICHLSLHIHCIKLIK